MTAEPRAPDLARCRSCGAPIFWGKTAAGKLCPFDVTDGQPTAVSHFTTCTDPNRWSKKGRP